MKKLLSLIMAVVTSLASIAALSVSAYAAPGKVVLNVYNWGEYIEQTLLDRFEDENPDIRVNYTTYDSNEAMYSKIVSGAASYDIVVPSDYMISKLIEEDMLAELNYDNIPNFKYIGETYRNLEYDPENKYTVPFFWGTVVIIYNSAYVDEADVARQSIDLLWDEKYAGKILMFDNPRDAFALALTSLGYSMNSEDPAQWAEAAELLSRQKPLVQAYVMDAIFDKMGSSEAWIAPYYAGDALIIQEDNEDVDFYMPKEGTNMFVDAMCVLKSSENKEAAERFINFMCNPEVAAINSDTVGYATANTGAMEILGSEVTDNELIYPSEEYLSANTEVFINLPNDILLTQSKLWTDLKIESAEESEDEGLTWIDISCIAIVAAGAVGGTYFIIRNSRRRKLWKQ